MQWIDPDSLHKIKTLNSFGSMSTELAAGYLRLHPCTLSRYSNMLLREFGEYLLWQQRNKAYSGRTLQLITLYRLIKNHLTKEETFNILWELLQQHNYDILSLCENPEQLNESIDDIYSPTKQKIPC